MSFRMNFEDLGLESTFLRSIKELGFERPTMIQQETIPHINEGFDVVGESSTGSGKTLAFASGIIKRVVPGLGIQGLVITPTRELAEQVKDMLVQLSDLRIVSVYGGVSIDDQVRLLRSADVVVATPGRLLDHIHRGNIDLSRIKVLVLDEADRVLDMGFIDDVEEIISYCPVNRQTLFFSATVPSKLGSVIKKHLKKPVFVSVNNFVDDKKLEQYYFDTPRKLKFPLLTHILKKNRNEKVMVFCNTRRNVDFVVDNLRLNNVRALGLHGGYSQNKRNKTIRDFSNSRTNVLVCTDVAARGLDIKNISLIINYDIPRDPKEYVHRIGRTARAGASGRVINLLCDYDYDNFSRIIENYRDFSIKNLERPFVERVRIRKVNGFSRS